MPGGGDVLDGSDPNPQRREAKGSSSLLTSSSCSFLSRVTPRLFLHNPISSEKHTNKKKILSNSLRHSQRPGSHAQQRYWFSLFKWRINLHSLSLLIKRPKRSFSHPNWSDANVSKYIGPPWWCFLRTYGCDLRNAWYYKWESDTYAEDIQCVWCVFISMTLL